jgi:hypothetical protein
VKAMTIRQVVLLSIGKGSAGPWHLEPIFVDFETLDFRIERSGGQPEFRGGAGWAPSPVHNIPPSAVSMISFSCRARARLSYSRGYGHVRMPEAPATSKNLSR